MDDSSTDDSGVLTLDPTSLYDKNLYAYCDNNPVSRADEDGDSWLLCIGAGLLTQYASDVIWNIIEGKENIFELRSSIGEYVAAGITALVPGSGIGASLIRNVITESIVTTEKVLLNEEINTKDSVKNIIFGTVLDLGFEKITNFSNDYFDSKIPINYSSHANKIRKNCPNSSKKQIYRSMRRSIRVYSNLSNASTYGIGVIRTMLPY